MNFQSDITGIYMKIRMNKICSPQVGKNEVALNDHLGKPALFEQVLIVSVAGIRPELQTYVIESPAR